MSVENRWVAERASEKTAIAAIVAILMVVPGMIPAAIVTVIYGFFFSFYTAGGSWIPYVDEIGRLWFPEMLRGAVVGAVAIWVSRYFFPRSNVEAVRLAALAFWGAIMLLAVIVSVSVRGMTLDVISVVALMTGFGVGLWVTDH